jgi:hypothetical protein
MNDEAEYHGDRSIWQSQVTPYHVVEGREGKRKRKEAGRERERERDIYSQNNIYHPRAHAMPRDLLLASIPYLLTAHSAVSSMD